MKKKRNLLWISGLVLSCVGCLTFHSSDSTIEAAQVGSSHLGTFEGSTTFTTSSENGINPGLFIEVVDDKGNLTQYESEEGVITIPNTKEGAYITQAKLLGKTKYVDQDTGEVLDAWEEGRNLRLESVKMPVLTSVSSTNLYVMDELLEEKVIINTFENSSTDFINVYPNEKIFFSTYKDYNYARFYDDNKQPIGDYIMIAGWNPVDSFFGKSTHIVPENGKYLKVFIRTNRNWEELTMVNRGEDYLPYEKGRPYKSNILTVNESIELRGIGDVRDTLDCLTGEVTQRIGEIVLDGSTFKEVEIRSRNGGHFVVGKVSDVGLKNSNDVISELRKVDYYGETPFEVGDYANVNGGIGICVSIDETAPSKEDGISFLENTKYKLLGILETPTIKTVVLSASHQFPLLDKSFIQVNGTIPPVITSITVPSESLTFNLDPNQEARQQFIAPEFEVTNESNAPLNLTLKTFEQTSNVLNDVLPTKYDSWEGLTKEQSKDIALGLVSKPSDGWLSCVDTPHYVSETDNKLLGTIKPKGMVEFGFIAHHGQSFSETLSPSYRMTFVFDLLG